MTNDADQDRLILDSVERFLDREVKAHVPALEHDDIYPAKIVETVSTVWMSVAGIFNAHLIMAAAVERFGTPAQKAAFLPRFATGELRGGLALTEPDCGTDLQAIRNTARRAINQVGGNQDYVINGTKTWI